MGRVEDVTLPARFLTTTAHLIATLTIVYDAVRARANAPLLAVRARRSAPRALARVAQRKRKRPMPSLNWHASP